MRYLGLDLGSRTLGVSVSDKTGLIASNYKTIRHNEEYDKLLDEVVKLVNELEVEAIVLGFPKNMNNTIGPKGELSLNFKEKLEKIKYIDINKKTQIITPTNKGEIIYDIVYSSMPDMLNPKLTASWEKGLDMVAKKEIKPEVFMSKLENYINSKFNKLVVKM